MALFAIYRLSLVYMLNDLFHTVCYTIVSILALTTGNSVYLISTKAHGGCDLSAEDAYFSMALSITFAFVGSPCCPTLDFVIALWIIITFYTLLTLLFCIVAYYMYLGCLVFMFCLFCKDGCSFLHLFFISVRPIRIYHNKLDATFCILSNILKVDYCLLACLLLSRTSKDPG
jgi:hypothetical protein